MHSIWSSTRCWTAKFKHQNTEKVYFGGFQWRENIYILNQGFPAAFGAAYIETFRLSFDKQGRQIGGTEILLEILADP